MFVFKGKRGIIMSKLIDRTLVCDIKERNRVVSALEGCQDLNGFFSMSHKEMVLQKNKAKITIGLVIEELQQIQSYISNL